MSSVRGLIAAVRVVAGFEILYTHDRRGNLAIVGPEGWIDERRDRLRFVMADGQFGYFMLRETPAVIAALLNIGAAQLDTAARLDTGSDPGSFLESVLRLPPRRVMG